MKTSFYTREELMEIGFQSVGEDVLLSRKASVYSAERIKLGNHVRIDDFCILSGTIELGDHIHIAAYSALYGGTDGIVMEDFSGLSSRVCVYSASDDYTGWGLTGPTIPDEYRNVESAPVHIGRHVIVGSRSIILPGVLVGEGSSFGSFSFVNRDTEPWSVNAGIPAKKIRERSRHLLEFEKQLLEDERNA